jgi:hypothetical protein
MSRPLADLTREAIELPQDQRLMLARILLDASESAAREPISEIEAVWENEIVERIKSVDSGAQEKSLDSVLLDINKRFLRRKVPTDPRRLGARPPYPGLDAARVLSPY